MPIALCNISLVSFSTCWSIQEEQSIEKENGMLKYVAYSTVPNLYQ
jgi:hypothetical protein